MLSTHNRSKLRIFVFYLFFIVLHLNILNASYIEALIWQQERTFLEFLEEEELPLYVYHDADKSEKTLIEDIPPKVTYYILRDYETQRVQQVLIPINIELQLHIYKSKNRYILEFIPLEYQEKEEEVVLEVKNSPYYDIKKETNSEELANVFFKVFDKKINFSKEIKKGDRLVMIYSRYYRLGEPVGKINFKVAMLETDKKENFAINFDEKIYDINGEIKEEEKFALPVKNPRISSRFTKRRWHPILKKYRSHLGVDFAGRRGTPIYAIGDGIVDFAGWNRGYGKVIKIKHNDVYLSLYAHMSKFRSSIKKGKKVKKGDLIGYIGSTGLSTGPHLHFGLYEHDEAVDPLKVLSISRKKTIEDDEKYSEFVKLRDEYKIKIENKIKDFEDGLAISHRYKPVELRCVYYTEEELDYGYNVEELELSEEYLSY